MKATLIILNSWHANITQRLLRVKHKGGYAPSGLRILASLIPAELNVEVELRDENIETIDFDKISSDIVGISVLTANAPRAYSIADRLRQRGITVVMGGYHVSVLPQEALQHADAVVIGFAEHSFPQLMRDFASGNLRKIYDHCANEAFLQHKPLSNNPPLYNKQYIWPATLETTRGCYNTCNFCVLPSNSSQYLQKPIGTIVDEITLMNQKRVTFLDFSPFEDTEYALELFEALKPLKIKWYSCMTTRIAENAMLVAKAAESGCSGVLTGFESINPAALQAGNKMINKPARYNQIIETLRRHKIMILGSFIFGFDEDDRHVFRDTLDFIGQSQIDILHYAILTPFPGTRLYQQMLAQNRLLTTDWSKYDGTRAVFEPAKMTPDELQEGYFHVYKKSHSVSSIIKRLSHSRSDHVIKLMLNTGFRMYIESFIHKFNKEAPVTNLRSHAHLPGSHTKASNL
jgi:radical SAM superfamily enzyme YgiQ (UPF0313 family)